MRSEDNILKDVPQNQTLKKRPLDATLDIVKRISKILRKELDPNLFATSQSAKNICPEYSNSDLNLLASLFIESGLTFENNTEMHQAIFEYKKAFNILRFIERENGDYSSERMRILDKLSEKILYTNSDFLLI